MVAHVPQDVTTHLMNHLSLHPTLRTCSSDTILRAIKELTQENISYTSDTGKNYDFNTADSLNTLLLNCMFASGQLKEGEMYDVDFDHQFIETEKYDAKPTYKKFSGYRPGVAVIGDMIVGIENSDGNTNVRFHQQDTLKRFFERFERNNLVINRFRTDCQNPLWLKTRYSYCSQHLYATSINSSWRGLKRKSSDTKQQVASKHLCSSSSQYLPNGLERQGNLY